MNDMAFNDFSGLFSNSTSMEAFGEIFIEALPRHLERLKISGRLINDDLRSSPLHAQVEKVAEIQGAMREVLCHPATRGAQGWAEKAFGVFLGKEQADVSVLRFFNGWNETHKTTSLVSAKIIMRLSADFRFVLAENQEAYNNVLAHMHEVARDDFGLGHEGHDGMYAYMAAAFGASDWAGSCYAVGKCCEFSSFLYDVGVAKCKFAITSAEYKRSVMSAMMVSVASELWNGCEYNFIAQFIEQKLIAVKPSLRCDAKGLRAAKGYIFGHSGEVEN